MCGIVGFCGNKQAAPILLDGLSKLNIVVTILPASQCAMAVHRCRLLKLKVV